MGGAILCSLGHKRLPSQALLAFPNQSLNRASDCSKVAVKSGHIAVLYLDAKQKTAS